MTDDTGTDLAVVTNPATGELVALQAPTDILGYTLDEVRQLEQKLREFKRAIADEVLVRMDEAMEWTAHLGGLSLSAPRPGAEEWDAKVLEAGLKALAAREVIDAGALEKVIGYEPKVYKRGISGLQALAKAGNAEVADLLRRARKPPKSRSITIEVHDARD